MAPFRIPFTSKKPTNGVYAVQNDENARPVGDGPYKPSLALGLKEGQQEPNEFKMSCKARN